MEEDTTQNMHLVENAFEVLHAELSVTVKVLSQGSHES